jgi:hypothetical protein
MIEELVRGVRKHDRALTKTTNQNFERKLMNRDSLTKWNWARPVGVTLVGIALLSSAIATATAAEMLSGMASNNRLVLFSSANPGDVAVMPLSGLQPGEEVLGLDVRPATGQLYALGSSSRLYTIDPATGMATAIGSGPFTPALSGTSFGFDFNPTVDRIRIVSDTGQNLRANPTNGIIVAIDGALSYATNDVDAGGSPMVVAAAYTNNDNDPTTGTTLFNIDAGADTVVMQNPPNNGTLVTMGMLGVDATRIAGFDIAASDATAYAALVEAGQPGNSARASLYSIDLMTGAATALGKIGGPKPLTALATLGQLP